MGHRDIRFRAHCHQWCHVTLLVFIWSQLEEGAPGDKPKLHQTPLLILRLYLHPSFRAGEISHIMAVRMKLSAERLIWDCSEIYSRYDDWKLGSPGVDNTHVNVGTQRLWLSGQGSHEQQSSPALAPVWSLHVQCPASSQNIAGTFETERGSLIMSSHFTHWLIKKIYLSNV